MDSKLKTESKTIKINSIMGSRRRCTLMRAIDILPDLVVEVIHILAVFCV